MKKFLVLLVACISFAGYAFSTKNSTSHNNNGVVEINSNRIYTSYHSWSATQVILTQTGTIVTKVCQPYKNNTWVQTSGTEFIEDCDTGIRYYIRDSSLPFSPDKLVLPTTASYTFTETYPVLPDYVTRINICSGAAYYVQNLKIR